MTGLTAVNKYNHSHTTRILFVFLQISTWFQSFPDLFSFEGDSDIHNLEPSS